MPQFFVLFAASFHLLPSYQLSSQGSTLCTTSISWCASALFPKQSWNQLTFCWCHFFARLEAKHGFSTWRWWPHPTAANSAQNINLDEHQELFCSILCAAMSSTIPSTITMSCFWVSLVFVVFFHAVPHPSAMDLSLHLPQCFPMQKLSLYFFFLFLLRLFLSCTQAAMLYMLPRPKVFAVLGKTASKARGLSRSRWWSKLILIKHVGGYWMVVTSPLFPDFRA